jgi:hypothetical protein
MDLPGVSICIPSYNYARYLGEALRSACAQTYPRLEIVLIDDQSSDDSVDVAEKMAAEDPRIRVVRNARNLGLQANFNRCIELASFDLVKMLCADDLLAPTCVEAMVEAMLAVPGVALAACARQLVDEKLRPVRKLGLSGHAMHEPGTQTVRRCFFRGNLIGEPSAVLFRKSLAGRGFNENYKQILDMELWFRVLEQGAFAWVPEPLCLFRQHSGRATHKHLRDNIISADRVQLFEEYGKRSYIRPGLADKLLWDGRMAWILAREQPVPETSRERFRRSVYFPALHSSFVAGARVMERLRAPPPA